MDYDELTLFREISREITPLIIKIGGPEARTDIRFCSSIVSDGIVAPMVESEYALRNYVSSLKSLIPPNQFEKTNKAINIETITAYRNILDIVDSHSFEIINSVIAARSDLSASMNMHPDDPEVMRIIGQIVKLAKEKNKATSVGGTITSSNFYHIMEKVAPNYINSRHIVISLEQVAKNQRTDVPEIILEFEIELYVLLSKLKPEKSYAYLNRIEINKERMGKKKVTYSVG
ncbi:MAG: aldolase [Leptospiraceae bacterium]|nr:aldolase [Leptospiraceae bacterium]